MGAVAVADRASSPVTPAGNGSRPRAQANGSGWRGKFLLVTAGFVVGAVVVAVTRPAAPSTPPTVSPTNPVQTVYVPAPLDNSPSELERVQFEKFCDQFLRTWVQPGPVEVRRQALAPMMTAPGLRAQLARTQDRLPRGLPTGPPQIANTSPIGGICQMRLSLSGVSVEVIMERTPTGWLVDDVQGE